MTAPLLRLARPDDGPALARIYRPWVLESTVTLEVDPPSAATMAQRVGDTLPRWPWVVAVDATEGVVGYAYGGPYRARSGYRWTVEVSAYLDGSWRRHGVGRQLYTGLLGLLSRQGHRQAIAGIGLPNESSVAFHEAQGFAHAGTTPAVGRKFSTWQDVGWWQRPLGPASSTDPSEPVPLDRLGADVVHGILG